MSSLPPAEGAAEPDHVETVHAFLRRRAGQEPDRIALDIAGGETLTFRRWEERSNAAARALLARRVRPGSRVALLFSDQDWIDYAVAYLGVLKAGGTAVHLSADVTADELRRRWAETGAEGLVHSTGLTAPAGFDGWVVPAAELVGDTAPVQVPTGPDDLADILYTSGTTGPAKAYTNPHSTLMHGRRPAGLKRLDGSAPLLAPMPMGTPSSAMSASLMPLNSPSTVVLCHPDDIESMGRLIARYGVATVLATPWIAQRMVAERLAERYDLSSVTTVAIASAALPASTARALREMMPGLAINTAYAQGEAVPAVILGSFDPDRPLALGRPAPGTELRVADPEGEAVPDGEIGEIWLRSAAATRRYVDESLNALLRDGDGWIRTRDLGRVGADGDLYLFDRMTDAVRVGDRLVSTLEVEGVLYDHPAVREAAVFGVPGPDGDPAVVAALVLDPSPEAEAEVTAFLRERLEPPRIPSAVHVVDALPRGVTGKVLKHRLRERLPVLTDRHQPRRAGTPS
ncbi:class I adenylate-forming enzyme family protein [Streptomyces sp. NPDC047981]|uniref:class I adenylate-forming enzyme family protein n=1 Tax=Streptomyces sp. NPDC047981 TaxID=3154610 RepID=UPI00341D29F1